MRKLWKSNLKLLKNQDCEIAGTLRRLNPKDPSSLYFVSTYDDEKIIIEAFPDEKKLRQLLGKSVIAKGRLRKNEAGQKFLYAYTIDSIMGPAAPGYVSLTPNYLSGEIA